MARTDLQQRAQVKLVIIAAHLPDCKFEGGFISGSIDSMPVSGLVLELHRTLWGTTYTQEYRDFLKLMENPQKLRRQAISLGLSPESHNKVKNIKRHIDETLIEDAVYRMPQWLSDKAIEVYELNLKGEDELW